MITPFMKRIIIAEKKGKDTTFLKCLRSNDSILDLRTMVSDEEKEIEQIKQEIEAKAKKRRKKSKKKQEEKAIDDAIHMNRWGILFFFLFFAMAGYLIISYQTGLPPFEIDIITNEISLSSDLLLTILLAISLALLGLGIYFGWIKEQPTSTEQEKEGLESISETKNTQKKAEGTIVFSQKKDRENND